MRLLVTGGSGFIGSRLIDVLAAENKYEIVAVNRRSGLHFPVVVQSRIVQGLSQTTEWSDTLKGVDVVIHTAARAHVMSDYSADPLAEFRRINVEGTIRLASHAVEAGVKRFIFLSSIKVNGESTVLSAPYHADSKPAPADPYAISKMEAEQGLRVIAQETGMEVVIIRPTLVYGPGVKANFLSMMRWLISGIPLPFGAIHNRRSLVALDNLVDLIVTCIDHPAAANETFLVSDGEDLSTTELLHRMGTALGVSARLLPVPAWLLMAGATVLGRKSLSQRLCGSLQVDITKTRERLEWEPPVSVAHALDGTARHFLKHRN
ncbi:NAD-dependent dehydratase [Pseudomonas fluorescens NCIMB 11764]|uniref:NAD-dependent dehydratase n=1 Tax=Pseudomonas fluorescens NCIMB 11764 TaxID=1221522 RepID=A0A0K1QP89_PSEFL|nr:SDR family oxidoreductase [Pseudomonas fluorescens]AKV07571.1 NAD-dependent dehydratase [Pseudomonas fluorescens NCIMB 11764]